MENDARAPNSILETKLSRFLADIGTKLAGEPEVRADINRGMMMVIRTFVQNQKREIAKFIGNQIKSWDVRQMTSIIELNIGADLQYIRLNGSIIAIWQVCAFTPESKRSDFTRLSGFRPGRVFAQPKE